MGHGHASPGIGTDEPVTVIVAVWFAQVPLIETESVGGIGQFGGHPDAGGWIDTDAFTAVPFTKPSNGEW